MAYTTIDDPSEFFTTTLYTGNGSDAHSITNSANSGNFKPDWLWTKNRTGTARNHSIFDSNRGVQKYVYTNTTDSEATASSSLQSFDTNGFTVGTSTQLNPDGNSMVAWQWVANGGTTSSNTSGDVTSTVQANTTAGFSIVTWASTGGNESVGHGLGVTPSWFICKNRSAGANWKVYHQKDTSEPETNNTSLNKTDQSQDDAAAWNDTAPTSTTFTVGTDAGSGGSNGNNMVAYCFAEVKGYSKFGSYTGNGDANGAFVYTGFKPAWLMVKNIESARNWMLFDNKRGAINVIDEILEANTTDAERDGDKVDFLSNGFKMRDNGSENNSSEKFIYMAFAEHPFVSSKGVPTTAR